MITVSTSAKPCINTRVKAVIRESGEGEHATHRSVPRCLLHTGLDSLNTTDGLEPLGKSFRLCGARGEETPLQKKKKAADAEILTNVVNVGGIFVKLLEMLLRNSGAESLRWLQRKSRSRGRSATKTTRTFRNQS